MIVCNCDLTGGCVVCNPEAFKFKRDNNMVAVKILTKQLEEHNFIWADADSPPKEIVVVRILVE